MKKYWLVAKNNFSEYFIYRLNFILWRLRSIISFLTIYFLWMAIFQNRKEVFGYSQMQMLTYILLTIIVNSIVFSTKTFRIAMEINFGDLSNFLIRPVNYFLFNFFRDISDKLVNIFFSILEMIFIFLILKPPIFLQTNFIFLASFVLEVILASLLYFEIGMLLSFIGFWSKETWAPRFIFGILVAFLAGNYFPLDIAPSYIYRILEFLPFTYLLFYPLKIYLGQIAVPLLRQGFLILGFWIILLFFLLKIIWRAGLKIYTSEGK